MSDRPIQVGDLVIVVRGLSCCGARTGREGTVFTVQSIVESQKDKYCHVCWGRRFGLLAEGPTLFYDVSRLKRIPPLSELESIDQQEPANV